MFGPEVKRRISERFADELNAEIKVQLYTTNLRNKDKIAANYYCEINPDTLAIEVKSNWKPASYLSSGTKEKLRGDLIGKRIPIKLKDGRTIIRTVTWREIISGRWRTPGIKGNRFLDLALMRMRSRLPKIIKEELRDTDAKKTMSF